jgi:hypothetical protein
VCVDADTRSVRVHGFFTDERTWHSDGGVFDTHGLIDGRIGAMGHVR